MKISLKWLSEYIPLDYSPEKISEMLTIIGLEVEGVEEVEMIKGGLKGVIVGSVLSRDKHPNADKLSICNVDIGLEEPVQIVCGAPNVDAGQKVLVATIGTTLYDDKGEPWKIKKGKIRSEESHGMICAEDELGLGKSHEGIMVLDPDAVIGTAAAELFKLESDIVFDIGLTPNRSDATCHIGVAEDLAAYINVQEGKDLSINYPEVSSFKSDQETNTFKVELEDKEGCPRYSGLSISGIEIKDSPDWMQKHLKAIGIRPISNIVDITNYILHEFGQPLHAFDADKIAGNTIRVKRLTKDTTFITLDEKERKLHEDDLMICDGDSNPMCIAGVFGGISSGVTADTKNIFLESAHFNAGSVRKTSTRHLLRTDAAKCFEKGSDPNITVKALKRAAILIKQFAGGIISSKIVDEYPTEIKPVQVQLHYAKVNEVIGNELSKSEIQGILQAMGMEMKAVGEDSLKVSVPTNKADVTRDIDLIEEILRIYGFNKIETSEKIRSSISYSDPKDGRAIKNKIRNYLAANACNQMMNLSLIQSRLYEKAYPLDTETFVYINNTSNVHLDIMRPEMMLSGLTAVAHNLNRQQYDFCLFEFGKVYKKLEGDYDEQEKLCLFMTGKNAVKSWRSEQSGDADFYDLKALVNNLLDVVNVNKYQMSNSESDKLDFGMKYHRGNNVLVNFGQIANTVLSGMDIKQPVYYAEFDMKELITAVVNQTFVKKISKFPAARRDLALVLDEAVMFSEIKTIINKVDKKLIKEIDLFDVYRNEEQIGKDKKSYALSILFENVEKTLNDKEVDKIIQKIVSQTEQQLGALVRN